MSSWADVARDAPEFASRVRAVFDSGTNKTIATLRADGAPRISGTELVIGDDSVTLGIMPNSRRLADVTRDPRVAIHSPTIEPPLSPRDWRGDAKLSGRLEPIAAPDGAIDGSYFAVDIVEVVLTSVNETETKLVVESWHPDRGYQRRERT